MSDRQTKYGMIVSWGREQVLGNNLRHGEKFYSEKELSERFQVSRQTVRQAIGVLQQEGIIECRQGSGTYVVHGSSVKREHARTIGVISTYLDSYIFPKIIQGIDHVLAQNGYTMQLSFTHNQVENESRALRQMLDNGVDGLIVEPTKSGLYNPNAHLYDAVRRRGIPLIFFNAYYQNMDFPHVCMDDERAGYLATKHLISLGHREIAGIFQSDDRQGHLRYTGYVKALKEADIDVRSANVLWFTTEDIPHLSEEFSRVMRRIGTSTAVVCYNDQLAFTVISALRQQEIAVPDDLSVIGIDNADIATLCEVPLTTLSHPMARLGEQAAQNILRLIAEPAFDATVIFEPALIVRESAAPFRPDKNEEN